MGLLLAAYAESVRTPFRYLLPEPTAPVAPADSPPPVQMKYPMTDRQGDFVTDQQTDPFYLKDPPVIVESVEYDPETGMYVVSEKVGGIDVRPPMYLSFEDYMKYTEEKEMKDYWKERANAVNLVEEKSLVPPVQIKNQVVDRLFGGSKIEIKPQGNVEMTLGANIQKTANPNIPIRNRQTGGFNFDMNINMNVIGKIGDKLQLGIKYNTQSGFAFDNTVKIGYTGGKDDIIKDIEAGNVTLPLPTRLITGSQSLFGLKTVLQFGRLTWTSVVSQQQSKKQSITLQNGAQQQTFSVNSDQYEADKNFFLSQFFYNQYDGALAQLPKVNSVVNITRIEVWVTNRTNATTNVRNIVGLMDLGEATPFSNQIQSTSGGNGLPRNTVNSIYNHLTSVPSNRLDGNIVAVLQGPGYNLQQGQDFEKTYARKLNPNEFTFNPQLGYISINSQLNPNDILGVAFQYEYNGTVYQVGEFGDQLPPDSGSVAKDLILKLLKGTAPRTNLPIWKLMMKNIYSLGAFGISPKNFFLDVYYNDPATGLKRYIPQGCLEGKPLLHELNLDNLDMNNDPLPPTGDGLFDFLPGIDILPQNGKLIFTCKEPFGKYLQAKMEQCGDYADTGVYLYQQLYDSTKYEAQQFPQFNRFVIKGTYMGTNGSQISLGAGNIPRGSVVVTAGGVKLIENQDYTVDYNLGRVTITNQSILNSGQQIKIDYENNNQFATQTQSMYATRFDYKASDKLLIGGTFEQLAERPFTQKVNMGDETIKNDIFGNDFTYKTNLPWLTTALSKLYNTKEMSTLSAYGEWAYLKPGHSKAINDANKQGQIYIDDFEGTSSGYDLKTPPIAWKLASTPRNSIGANGQVQFKEGSFVSDERYGYNRALFSWYQIDNSFYTQQTAPAVVFNNTNPYNDITNNYVRLVPYQEVYPNATPGTLDVNLYTFDLAYFPSQRGPYNYESKAQGAPGISAGINSDGSLKSPATRWGGIMRAMDNTDFEATNVQYIDFWLMDPFQETHATSQGGYLYIDLCNISEDILQDSRQAFENGLGYDTSANSSTTDNTFWGVVPKLVPLVNAFDNDPTLRPLQDVGLDGMSDNEERIRKATFLANINAYVTNQAVLTQLNNDPSSDDYYYFQDPNYFANEPSIINRYKYFQGTEGNSPVQTNSIITTASTSLPDKEDVNNDNTMNEDEEYFQYVVHMVPGMNVGTNPYIITEEDGTNDPNIVADGTGTKSRWLEFRVPINSYSSRVGSISDFTSIQFMRMFLTGFADSSIIFRFGTLQLTRNQWRTYDLSLDDGCDNVNPHPSTQAFFTVGSVGLENNGSKVPVNYVLPPGIVRQEVLGAQTNQYVQQDEQSLDVQVCDLQDCQRQAVFKNITLDLRNYKRLEMYVHANRILNEPVVKDSEVTAFIRIGSDFVDNYYEYEVPLKITADGIYNNASTSDQYLVWPANNSMTINLQDFVTLKEKRNATNGFPLDAPFTSLDAVGNLITIKGNPNIGGVKTVMLGIHNPHKGAPFNPLPGNKDDGQPKCVEVWFDELRLDGFNEQGGAAALANATVKMADLGTVSVAGNMHTSGFGQVDKTMDQLTKDNLYSYNVTTQIEAGKVLPAALGIRIPFYANYAESFSTPEYDPYQFDIKSKVQFGIIRSAYGLDSLHQYQQEVRTINTTKGFNFTNVRIVPKTKSKRPHIYDPGNFNFTYSQNDISYSDPFTALNSVKTWVGIINWSFAPQVKDFAPFKKLIKSKSKWFDLVRDLSFNPYPSTMAVTSNWNRVMNTIQLRSLGDVDFPIPTEYAKTFVWNRSYTFKYNPFKSLSIEYGAKDLAVIDEPQGLVNTSEERQQVWDKVLDGGRNTNYNQNLAVNYIVPLAKIPALDFITANAGYTATYSWTALPLQLKGPNAQHDNADSNSLVPSTLGNIINNTQNDHAKVDFNFRKLYDKNEFLKVYDSPNPNLGDKKENDKKREAIKNARKKIKDEIAKLIEKGEKLKGDLQIVKNDQTMDEAKQTTEIIRLKKEIKLNKKAIRAKRKELRTKQYPSDPFISFVMRPLLSLKKIGIDYKENKATTLPGFEGYSRVLGNDYSTTNQNGLPMAQNAPGYAFVFGSQPGDMFIKGVNTQQRLNWLNRAAANNWISSDTLLNQQFTQNREDRIDATASFEPWTDFKIDLTLFRDYSDNYSEYYKYIDTTINGNLTGSYQHLDPVQSGAYSISYLPIKTLFSKISNIGYSAIYNNFVNDRAVISQRLGARNPNSTKGLQYYNPSDSLASSGFADGYGPLSQDVLIPAFLAAYEKKSPNAETLNPFNSVPMPNWRLSYNGLTKFKWAQKYFTNFTVTSGYSSTLTVSNYSTNLNYSADASGKNASARDSLSNNFYSLYTMPSITINESLSPLIGIDGTTKKNITFKVDFKMSRTLTMSFADFQMIQINSKSLTVGAGYKIKGLKLPFKLPNGKKIRLDNDLSFRFDFSWRDDITVNNQIDQGPAEITQGATTYTIQPSVDYIVSKRLTVRLFYDESKTIPKISSTYPTTNIKSGITFRFSLAE